MRINDDMTIPTIVHAARMPWVPSPAAGVDRRMLFRVGVEVARATSVVRYAPGSTFARHTHTGGEEILVLDGTFQDEHGDYPAGSYFRNPPGTSHVPAAKDGCTILVRLWQFREGDHIQVVRRPGQGRPVEPRPGASAATVLFHDSHEEVRIEEWKAGETVRIENRRGLEVFVISGGLSMEGETLEPQSWVRLPVGSGLSAAVGQQGTKIWLRDAPLLHPDVLQMPE